MQTKIKIEMIRDMFFLCNYENGAIVYVDDCHVEEIAEYVRGGSADYLSEETREYLYQCSFFERTDKCNRQAYVHVTDRCNMNCKGCYSRTMSRNNLQNMSLSSVKKILEQLKMYNVFRVVISGGEPMLRKDIVDIIAYGKELGLEMAMISNGSIHIPIEVMKLLDYLSFSIDILEEKTNSLNRQIDRGVLEANLLLAKENGINVNGIVTVNAVNAKLVDVYLDMQEVYGIPITFSIFYSAEEESIPFLLKDAHLRNLVDSCIGNECELVEGISSIDDVFCRENCGAGKCNMSIDAQGNLSPCHMLYSMSMGNLLKDGKEAWSNLERYLQEFHIPDECNHCEYKVLCGGGCKARTIMKGEKDPYCEMYRYYYQKQLEYIADLVDAEEG